MTLLLLMGLLIQSVASILSQPCSHTVSNPTSVQLATIMSNATF